jgi:hypothetical protein
LMVLPELSPQSPKTIVGRFVQSSSAPKFRTHSPGRAHHTSSAPGPFSWGGHHVTTIHFPDFQYSTALQGRSFFILYVRSTKTA